jgi:primosomal replication protein N
LKHNRLTLTATLENKEPLRYSPAGVPVLNFRLVHQSEQIEAGRPRTVNCELAGVAIGDTALKLAKVEPGQELQWSGFLATKRRYEIAELHVVEFIAT